MDMDVDFEATPMGPNFSNTITTLELEAIYNIMGFFSKSSNQNLSLEGANIFVENLKLGF